MVVNITLQTEINKNENKFYTVKPREFHPNLTVLPLTGKFYAWHDSPDPSLQDPLIENAILEKKILLPRDKYKEPVTTSMDYGWYLEKEPVSHDLRFSFHYPRTSTWITQIGTLIAREDKKRPKNNFCVNLMMNLWPNLNPGDSFLLHLLWKYGRKYKGI